MRLVHRDTGELELFLPAGLQVTISVLRTVGEEFEARARVRKVTRDSVRLELAAGSDSYPPAAAGHATIIGVSQGMQVRLVGEVEKSSGGRMIELAHHGVVTVRQRRHCSRFTLNVPYLVTEAEAATVQECRPVWEQHIMSVTRPRVLRGKDGAVAQGWYGIAAVHARPASLSSGGAALIVDHEYEPGTLVAIELLLPFDETRVVSIVAYAMRCEAVANGEFLLACSFVLVRDRDLTLIDRYARLVAQSAAK